MTCLGVIGVHEYLSTLQLEVQDHCI